MTREEAKAWFKVLLKDEYAFNSADREAFAMAIKALEQEPCENAISREDALMALTGEWTEITDEIIHRFIKRIKALPPVNPQPCEDAISRESLLLWLDDIKESARKHIGFLLDVQRYIRSMPSVNLQPCEDAISREATLKPYKGLNDEDTISVWLIRKNIEQQPPVTPQPKWIPVSERLPKIADVYRVTRYFPNNVMNPQYLVDACFFDGSNTWYNDNRINHERNYANNVIAWQENPEPYEPQESEDKG